MEHQAGWLTLDEAARYLGVSKLWLVQALMAGHLRAADPSDGHGPLFRIEWLDDFRLPKPIQHVQRDEGEAAPLAEEDRPWLTLRQAASYLQCSPTTIYRAVKSGNLKSTRVGDGNRDLRFRKEWLDAYMEGRTD